MLFYPLQLKLHIVNALHTPENIGLRPKIATWNECDTAIFTGLSKMLAGSQSPEETMHAMKKDLDGINSKG